jgi:hypothetical protein
LQRRKKNKHDINFKKNLVCDYFGYRQYFFIIFVIFFNYFSFDIL